MNYFQLKMLFFYNVKINWLHSGEKTCPHQFPERFEDEETVEIIIKVKVKRQKTKGLESLWEGEGVLLFSKGVVILDVLLFGS